MIDLNDVIEREREGIEVCLLLVKSTHHIAAAAIQWKKSSLCKLDLARVREREIKSHSYNTQFLFKNHHRVNKYIRMMLMR